VGVRVGEEWVTFRVRYSPSPIKGAFFVTPFGKSSPYPPPWEIFSLSHLWKRGARGDLKLEQQIVVVRLCDRASELVNR